MNRTPSSDETSDEETTYLLNHGEVVFSQDMSDSTALDQSQQVYNLRLHKVLFFILERFWVFIYKNNLLVIPEFR